MCYVFSPEERKDQDLEGCVFCTEPGLKVNRNNTVPSELVVLMRSTNQRIQPGLTRGQYSAQWPPTCVHNNIEPKASYSSLTYHKRISIFKC